VCKGFGCGPTMIEGCGRRRSNKGNQRGQRARGREKKFTGETEPIPPGRKIGYHPEKGTRKKKTAATETIPDLDKNLKTPAQINPGGATQKKRKRNIIEESTLTQKMLFGDETGEGGGGDDLYS